MKSNPRRNLKVPIGIHISAKELGVLIDVTFYYELKCLTVNGAFPKGTLIQYIQARYNYSTSAIWKKIRRLNDLGWIKRNKGNYNLCTYETMFRSLGYVKVKIVNVDVTKSVYHPRHNMNPCSIEELLMIAEIEGSLRKQEKKIKSLSRDPHTKKQKINPVATLSCEGVAKLLGRKTAAQGWCIEQQLQQLDLISIKNRKKFRGPKRCFRKVPRKCFVIKNVVIQQLPNEIRIV